MAEPADKTPESPRLVLVQDFVNTLEHPDEEQLPDPATAAAWLGARGFPAAVDDVQHRRLLETRELLRTLFSANAGADLPAESGGRLAAMLDPGALRPVVDRGGVHLATTGNGVDAFLAAILAALVESTIAGTFQRMKVCRANDCWWAFYDNSKNLSGAWCSMRSCGTRAKARAYRERQRGT